VEQNVKLVAITEGAEELLGRSAQEIISYVARVSNPSNQTNYNTAPKLIKYLLDQQHWSPFEHVSCTIEVKTSRALAAQILRHRSFVFSEFSQRYSQAFDMVPYEARRQDDKNRNNSIDDMSVEDKQWFLDAQEKVWNDSKALYDEALVKGIAKEQARFLLPLNTATTIYMTGNLRSWITYFLVRMEKSTQLEHREIATKCYEVLVPRFPDVSAALKEKYPHIFV